MKNTEQQSEISIEFPETKIYRDEQNNLVIDYVKGRNELDIDNYIRKSVLETDYQEVIKENCIIKEKGKPVLVYLVLDYLYDSLYKKILNRIKYANMNRSVGLISNSRTFGYMPRVTMKRDFCTTTSLAGEDPEGHDLICNLGKEISKYYKQYCPEMYNYHDEKSQIIKKDWKIEGTPFSSGIINKNNALKYHFDAGNIKSVYSNMVCFKKNCDGGYLSLPEFDIALEVANKSVTFFDGQDILHGVSPFKLNTYDGYRFTIVYYTLQQMWKCEPINEEIARIRKRRKEREINRVKLMKGEIDDSYLKTQILRDKDNTLKSKEFTPYRGKEKTSVGREKRSQDKN